MGFTKSFWQESATLPAYTSLKDDIQTDVCIIGAGIAGLTCAYLLQKKGKSVCVIEKNETIGGTQSQRTSGHLCWALDDRFYHIRFLFGDDKTKHIIKGHMTAIDQIEKIVKEENIDCGFSRIPGYLFLAEDDKEETLSKELDTLKELGFADVSLLSCVPIEGFNSGPCLKFPNQGEFHVGKYLSQLAAIIQKRGGKIFTSTHFKEINSKEPLVVICENGRNVQCHSAIFATNTPINDWVIMHTKQSAYRTYIIGGEIPKGSFPKILMWDTGDPYHYFRIVEQKDHDLLIIGGEDHKTGQDDNTSEKFEVLERWIKPRFPDFKPVYHWSGQIEEPVDSIAFIGKNPLDNSNVYIVTGDSGNGLTHGTIAGILLTDLITGVENPWKEIFQPSRKNLKSADEYISENANVAKQYLHLLVPDTSYNPEAIAKIPKDSGVVLQKGIHKRCVYKDENGKVHECSAICPHLYGEVQWNTAEKTWDCPCHGSRFDPYGKVIDGPAISDLS